MLEHHVIDRVVREVVLREQIERLAGEITIEVGEDGWCWLHAARERAHESDCLGADRSIEGEKLILQAATIARGSRTVATPPPATSDTLWRTLRQRPESQVQLALLPAPRQQAPVLARQSRARSVHGF